MTMMRKVLAGVIVPFALAVTLSSCQSPVVMWGSCSVAPNGDVTGTDGTYLLDCEHGTWVPVMTLNEFVRSARGENVQIAPLPHRPTTALSTSTPSNTTVDAGQTATFSTTASNGTAPYSYQWQVSTGGAYSNVSSGTGGTTATYTTASLTTGNSGNTYRVIVTDSAGVPVTVTSGAATLTVNAALSTTTPSNQTISLSVSNTATFSTITSNGTSPYSYQWQGNSQGISSFVNVSTGTGGTTASYTTGTLTISGNNGDIYRCIVTDSAGNPVSFFSGNATLTITA